MKSLVMDTAKSAEAINLIYVNDQLPGITRHLKDNAFVYKLEGKRITTPSILSRIKSLVLPPAWQNVWICKEENGHLQATGVDALGRKQYKYHPQWTQLRNQTKFFRLAELGKVLPIIRERLEQDLALNGLPANKVLAIVVSVMQETGIRIGNGAYEKLYGSYGLSTLKNKHVSVTGSKLKFTFRGKKGVAQDLTLKSKKLAKLVKQCRDIPGRELFQYYDEEGKRSSIDSGMVNAYIKDNAGGHFTAKDFRTWTGTVQALVAFRELGCANTASETKQKVIAALDAVSMQLGNTRTVCKKYYVHPALIELYECNRLDKFLNEMDTLPADNLVTRLHPEEQVLMKILEKI